MTCTILSAAGMGDGGGQVFDPIGRYLFVPSSILLTHAVIAFLVYSLSRQGVGRLRLALIGSILLLLVYLVRVVSAGHGLGAILSIYLSLRVYESVSSASSRVPVRRNATFIGLSGDFDEDDVSNSVKGARGLLSTTGQGQRRLLSPLSYVVVVNNNGYQPLPTVASDCDTISIEDISDVWKGCHSGLLKRISNENKNTLYDRCFTVTFETSDKMVVLIAEDTHSRDEWVEVLRQLSGNTFTDLRAAWLEKLCNTIKRKSLVSSSSSKIDLNTDQQIDKSEVTLDEAVEILSRAGRPMDRNYANELFKTFMSTANSFKTKFCLADAKLSKEQFLLFFAFAVQKPEISEIFERILAKSFTKNALQLTTFQAFILNEQKESLSRDDVKKLIIQYEPVLQRLKMSHLGFASYLLADEQCIFRRDCHQVYQNMTHPLSHYFIASSHNTLSLATVIDTAAERTGDLVVIANMPKNKISCLNVDVLTGSTISLIGKRFGAYLTKDQLRSKSSVDMYITAFKRGCKCVELDIWDGTSNEPVIYHGYTLTSKILVKDVLQAIKDWAFCVSPYPVILSFENHCSVEQQKIVAQYLQEILGNMLYTTPVSENEICLPSPNDLKGYILVKTKKLQFDDDTIDEMNEDDMNEDDDDEFLSDLSIDVTSTSESVDTGCDVTSQKSNGDINSRKSSNGDVMPTKTGNGDVTSTKSINGDVTSVKSIDDDMSLKSLDDDAMSMKYDVDDDDTQSVQSAEAMASRKASNLRMLTEMTRNMRRFQTEKAQKIAGEFSDLVVYCQTTRFKGIEQAMTNNKFYNMVSLGERRAFRVAREDPVSLIRYHQQKMTRVYPSGSHFDSSNYDPIALWNAGCQLVALNYQTACIEMQLNQAMFADNGGCGYVLKPEFMIKDDTTFDPRTPAGAARNLTIRVISGCQIPYKNESKIKSERNLSVQIRVFGVDSDIRCERTKVVKNNGFNPIWNEDIIFCIHVPELAFITFTVFAKDVFTAQYTISCRCLQQGFRKVPLLNKHSEPIPSAYLLVHVTDHLLV